MVRNFTWLPIFLYLLHAVTAGAAPLGAELSPAQLTQLSSGKPLVLEEEAPGEPWPVVTIWQFVKCTPEVLAGVFWDSELDPAYLPGCLSVRILSRPRPSVQEARFSLQMPLFLPEEVYVSRIELLSHGSGTYRISWNVFDSRYAKSCSGEIRMEPLGGMTLLRYRNFMVPKSRVAVLLRGAAKDRVVESVRALVTQAEKEVVHSPELIGRQQRKLREAGGG